MCLIAIGWQLRPDYPLILAANRDEFFARPATPAAFWSDHPALLAGRDLEQGGTWLGITRSGRLAAVTNYREGQRRRTGQRSRGWLVRDFLVSDAAPSAFVAELDRARNLFDGFNLLAGTLTELYYYSNRAGQLVSVSPGAHALSNHLLDTPWPKVTRAREAITALADAPGSDLPQALFALLSDRQAPPDEALPDTGIGQERERVLSTAFIRGADYGTRCSTVLLVDHTGRMHFEEYSYAADGAVTAHRRFEVFVPTPA